MGSGSEKKQDWSDKKIFTTGEAAQVCKVSQQTIIRCFDKGQLSGFRVPGSRFRRIPREDLIAFMERNSIPLDALQTPDPERHRVLIVDDDREVVGAIESAFDHDGGYEVRVAGTGYDAGLLTAEFRPDVIILDYVLPDIDGEQVCRSIRESETARHARVVIISGMIGVDEQDRMIAAGADAVLPKPLDVRRLLSRVRDMLEATV